MTRSLTAPLILKTKIVTKPLKSVYISHQSEIVDFDNTENSEHLPNFESYPLIPNNWTTPNLLSCDILYHKL